MEVRTGALALGGLTLGTVLAADPCGWAPFGPTKWLVVSVLALLGIGLTLRRAGPAAARRSWWTWAVLVALLSVAALTGGDTPTSLLGHPDRHLGVLTWFLLWGLFTAGQRVGADDRPVLASAGALGAAALGVWALAELSFGPVIAVAANTRRLTGPFGSAAYLGAAACLLGPVAASVALDRSRHRPWRLIGAFGAWGALVALIGSGSRGAWIAAAVTAGAVAIATRGALDRRRIALAGGALVLALVAVAPRLVDVTERTTGAASRLDEWRVATRVIGAHPLLGVGPEGYRISVTEGIDADYEQTYGRDEVLPDRAHSAPLDVALAGGVLAGLLYAGLLAFAGWRALCLLSRPGVPFDAQAAARPGNPRGAEVGLAAGVVAYGLQQLTLFPLAELDPVFWTFAGVVVAASAGTSVRRRAHPLLATGALVAASVALVAGMLDVAADRLAKHALTTSSVDDARRATRLRPDDVRYRLATAVVLARRGTLADVDAALGEMGAAARWAPHDPLVRDQHATLLLDRATITGSPVDVAASLGAWRTLVADDPARARWQLQLGRAAALDGDAATARRAWETAAALDPPRSDGDDTAGTVGPVAGMTEPIPRLRGVPLVQAADLIATTTAASVSFEAFYRGERAHIGRALAVTLRDRELAIEAVDEAMARAYARWDRVGSLDNPGGWVYRVGLNWSRSFLRRATRPAPLWVTRPIAAPADAPFDPAVDAALGQLSVDQRTVVVCRLLLGMSERETATALSLRPGTVKSRLHRATQRLHSLLDTEDDPR